MGFFDWLRGGPPELETARWMRRKIASAVRERDAIELANACASLAGQGMTAFGIVPTEFVGRAEVRDEAVEALRELMPHVRAEQCEQLFEIVTRSELPIDISERRARWEAECHEHGREIRAKLASCDADWLVTAC